MCITAYSLTRDIKEFSNRAIFIKLISFQNEIFLSKPKGHFKNYRKNKATISAKYNNRGESYLISLLGESGWKGGW